MHYPQLPDPTGYDVSFSQTYELADDWSCSEHGPVSDVHFWVSWKSDYRGWIDNIILSIYLDEVGQLLGDPVWQGQLSNGDFFLNVVEPYGDSGTGFQDWFEPELGTPAFDDHREYDQINCVDFRDPYLQSQGVIYWLSVQVIVGSDVGDAKMGWKTSLDVPFGGRPVWGDPQSDWSIVDIPEYPNGVDFAFVITPEPGTCVLLGIGGLAMALVRRRKK